MLTYESLETMRDELYNNGMDLTTLDNEKFVIVDGWDSLEKTIAPEFKAYLQDDKRIDFDKILAFLFVEHDNTLINFDDLVLINSVLINERMIKMGQLAFLPVELPDKKTIDNYHSILIDVNQFLDDNHYKEATPEIIKEYNQEIIDDMDSIEWGFSDEYTTCSECNNAIPLSPAHMSDYRHYYLTECSIICEDCCKSAPDTTIEEIVESTQEYIFGYSRLGECPTIPACLVDNIETMSEYPFTYIPYQDDYEGYNGEIRRSYNQYKNLNKLCKVVLSKYDSEVYQFLFDDNYHRCYVRININWESPDRYDDTIIAPVITSELLEKLSSELYSNDGF